MDVTVIEPLAVKDPMLLNMYGDAITGLASPSATALTAAKEESIFMNILHRGVQVQSGD